MIIDQLTGRSRQIKTDFTWFLERQHRDGKWEMVHSKGKTSYDRTCTPRTSTSDPARDLMIAAEDGFGDWDADWIGILLGEYPIPGQVTPLARPGWPADVSAFIAQEFRDEMFHGSCHFTLGDMRREITARRAAPSGFPATCVAERLAHLEYMLTQPLGMMFGRLRDTADGVYPDLLGSSSHTRMAAAKRGAGLLPVGPDTVRILAG